MTKKDQKLLRRRVQDLGGLRPLAEEIGVSHGTVFRWINGYKLSPMGRKMWSEYKAKIIAE